MLRRFLLHEDYHELRQRAIHSGIGGPWACGRGHEVAFIVPLVVVLRRIRRRRR
jgi:hypothetical protein